ncbi:MAG: T9SS type A sorting domain-containing protein [Pedobacter sp.]|nr:MAG: T9SS type A sorting domain-containing protein [Pedobacter sp.]
MKKFILSSLVALSAGSAFAQIVKEPISGEITTNTHWSAEKQYLLQGYVYVTAGNTLTIDKGVIIRGDKNTKGTLIVEKGAKIIANGTLDQPIIFTSNEDQGDRSYGDWGGLILCGNAPTNWTAGQAQVEGGPRSTYGGTDEHDNSGSLSFVRFEFGGIAFSPNNEVNGLTLCGVGDGTNIDHVQVSYSGDDAYEWFGGTVNSKYLVAFRTWDDDFDTDVKYSGKNQFLFVLRDPYAADQSGSKAFESDSYLAGTATGLNGDTTQATRAIFSNCTIMGPLVSPTSTAFDPQFVSGAQIRRGSALSILNSVIGGFPAGLVIDESSAAYGSTVYNLQNNVLQFRNNVIAGIPTNGSPSRKEIVYVKDGARNLTPTNANADTTTGSPFGTFAGPISWLMNPAFSNTTYPTVQNGLKLQNPFDLTNPNPVPTSISPICYNTKALPAYIPAGTFPGNVYPFNPTKPINTDTSGLFVNYNAPNLLPDFTNDKAADAFFTKTNYIGAFAGTQTTSDNWMKGWTNFDPNNTFYEYASTSVNNVNEVKGSSILVYPNPTQNVTNISFTVNKIANINVVVVDVTGKIVKNVFNGTSAKAGLQSYNVDVTDLKSGVYFVTVQIDGKKETTRMSVLK